MAQVRYFIVQAFVASCLLATLFKHTAAQAEITVDDSEDTDPWQDSVVRNLSLSDTTPPSAETIWNVQNILDTQQLDDQQNVQPKYPRIDKDSDEEQTTQTTTDNNGDDSDEEQTTTLQPETTTTEKTTTIQDSTTITKITADSFCVGFKPHTDNRFYLQFNGFNWLKKPCPYGLGFDQATCACSIKLLSHKSTTTTTIPEATSIDDNDDDDDSDEEEQTTVTTAETTTASTPEDDSNEEQTVTTTPETVSTTGDDSDEEETTTPEATTAIIEAITEEDDDDSKEDETTTPETATAFIETTTKEDDDDSKEDETTTPEATTTILETTTEEDDDSKDEDTTTPEASISTSETTSEEDGDNDESTEEETTTPEASTSTSETTSEDDDDNSDEEETTMTTTEATVTTQAETTTVTPSLELCKECIIIHAVGYAPYPGNCESFIQCRYAGDVPTAIIIKRCPDGLQWNQNKLTCDSPDNVKCVTVNKCPNQKSTDDDDNSAYFLFNGNDWTRVPCPSGTSYNKATCGCTDRKGGDDNDHHGNIQENCDDKKAIPGDKAGYLQLTAIGWVRMPCPATVGYNELTCRCTDTLITETPTSRCPDKKPISDNKSAFLQFTGVSWIPMPCPATLVYDSEKCICTFDVNDDDNSDSKDDDVCKSTITLNFDNDDATDTSHNGFWVNNTGVTFNDGKAYFNGKARLIIPGLANQDFGSTVYILVKYRHTSASSQQTIVANGDCRVRQSVAVCSGKDSVDFYAETKEELLPAKVTVPSDTKLWRYAVYAFDNDKLQGKVGVNQAEQPIKGNIDSRHSGLIVGGGGACDNFHGIIDELHVFLCKPSL